MSKGNWTILETAEKLCAFCVTSHDLSIFGANFVNKIGNWLSLVCVDLCRLEPGAGATAERYNIRNLRSFITVCILV
jgi:hypothetical protein